MKPLISTTVVLMFSLYMVPAMAFDNGGSVQGPTTFAAFRHMSTLERATLTPLADTELASIEGASLEELMAVLQQRETISAALLGAQSGILGCDPSCVAQIMTRLASSPPGAPPVVIQQASSPNGTTIAIIQQASSPNGTTIAIIQQMPSPNGTTFAVVRQMSSPNGTTIAVMQQMLR